MTSNPSFNFTPSPQAWRGAAFGIFIATLILMIFSTYDLIQNNVSLGDATLYFVAGSLITALIGAMLVFCYVLFANISALSKWAIACFGLLVYYFFIPTQTSTGLLLIGLWTIASFSLTFGALWSLLTKKEPYKKNRLTTLFWLLIGLLGIALLFFWFVSTDTTFIPPKVMESKKKPQILELTDPAIPGAFRVQTLTYASGHSTTRPEYGNNTSIITQPIDAELFISGWKGLSGWLRTRYWGFDSSEIPLNGQVWYPQGKGPFPLVIIVHGNHEMSTASDSGYAYLAKLFASHGFITASIDQNFLNGSWIDFTGNLNEVPARGWLILKHLQLWQEWNKSKDSIFFDKIDMEKIALIGHSRGGEAIATAAAFNDLSYYPGNGNVPFNYHFNIQALAAIAPVDAQYAPGGQKTNLNNIDYFVIQGAHDGDVRSFQGSSQYDRVHFTDPQYHFKASLYIFGANHGQFNTLWGKRDIPPPTSLLFNLEQFLPEKEQRQIAQVYLTAFLKIALQNEKEYLPLFHDWRAGGDWLPKTVYLNEFADSKEFFITNDETSIDIGKTAIPGGTVKGEHLKVWRQKQVVSREGNATHIGTFLGWKTSMQHNKFPSYTITLPKNDLPINSASTLILSLADNSHNANDDDDDGQDNENMGETPVDFTIELMDDQGEKASLPLSHYAFLQPALKTHIMKNDLLDPLEQSENIFQTFEFPLSDFMAQNPHFDPAALRSIRLLFNKTPTRLIILESISIRN